MINRPITEDDLHAYVDGVLEPERRAEVAAYLEGHPEMARRVTAFSDQRDQLRQALAPVADEPLPPQLNLSHIIEKRRRPSPIWWAIAAMLMLSIGGLGQCATGAVGVEQAQATGEAAGPDEFGLSPDGRAGDRDVARPGRDVHV
jgi:anti-sigma factor RsiW